MNFVFIDQDKTIKSEQDLQPLKKYGEVIIYDHPPRTDQEILARAEQADVIFFALTRFSREVFQKLPRLRVMQFLGTGVWNLVDVELAESLGKRVLNVEGYGNNAVAEYTIALAFSLARNIPRKDQEMRKGIWDLGTGGMEIKDSVFGVVGTGNIGSLVAQKAALLGARVLAYDLTRSQELQNKYGIEYVSLEELVQEADFITLHVKYNAATDKIISKNIIKKMKEGIYFINTARSALVDNEALYQSLKNQRIRGAALDVFEIEPLKSFEIAKLDNIITTPHTGFYTANATRNLLAMSIQSVLKELKSLDLIS